MAVTIGGKPITTTIKKSGYDSHLEFQKNLGGVKAKPVTATIQATSTQKGYDPETGGVGKVTATLKNDNVVLHKGLLTDGTSVSVMGGQTVNMENFNSVKFSVSVTVPTTKEDLNNAYEFASDWVSTKMAEALKEFKA